LRARIAGLFEFAFAGGFVLGALGAGKIWALFGSPATILGINVVSPAFSINTLVYLGSLVIFIWGLRDLRRRRRTTQPVTTWKSQLARYAGLIRSPGVWRFAPAWLAVNSIFGMWNNHSVRLLTGKLRFDGQLLTANYNASEFGGGVAAFGVLFGGGLLGWSMILGRFRKTSAMLGATGALFAVLVSVYGLNHLESFSSPLYYPLLAGLILGLIAMSAFTPAALVYLADVTESETASRGSIMGLYSVFLGVGQLIGTAAGGRFATWRGIDGILLLSAILGIITAVTLIVLRRQESTFPVPAAAST
jgi:predicted MFS family arabinose efflux permease